MDGIRRKNGIYPLLGILTSVVILVVGIITAKSHKGLYYLGGAWFLFLCFGYYKACLAVIPFSAVMSGIFCLVTYAISKDVQSTLAALCRILAVCVAVIPGLGMRPSGLVSNLSSLRAPRTLTLGMMIALSFFPLLAKETRQIREAMKTRGAGSILYPKIFYRAFLLPLIVRLVNISDTLSLSVETRGFVAGDKSYTVYKKIKFRFIDCLFAILFTAGTIVAVAI